MIITWGLLFAGPAFGEWPASKIARELAPSVIMVASLDRNCRPLAFGSGFFLNSHGAIATSRHLLLGASRVMVTSSTRMAGEVLQILKDDPALDLVIAGTSLRNTRPVNIGDSDRISPGQRILCLGHPEGVQGSVSRGIFLALRRADNVGLQQISAPLSPGWSGGPVFDDEGEVIGIATAYNDLGRDLNFAIPVNYLKGLRPSRPSLASLVGIPARLGAAMKGDTLVEILVLRDHPTSGRPTGPKDPEKRIAARRPPASGPLPGPGSVYFRSGKAVLCDEAWKEDRTVFLVVHGKRVAVGYDEEAIDMERSFLPSP